MVKMLHKGQVKSSMVFNENGETKINLRSSDMMPLASTVKIMVAMEYAYQVVEGKIDGEARISIKELEKYYLPGLDGGAHEAWMDNVKRNSFVKDGTVTLREVGRGMITFSSNANTEFLMDKLGITAIEERMKQTGVKDHTGLYYFVSAVFIPYEIKQQEFQDMTMKEAKDQILGKIKDMNEEALLSYSSRIHEKLAKDEKYKEKVNVSDWWNMDFDQLFSEIFIKSTTSEYAKIMQKINSHAFPERIEKELEYLLGALMENPANQRWLLRAGRKGGSTQYIMTDAMFAEDQVGNKFELAIFFDRLEWYQIFKLMKSLNEFELNLLKDKSFREDTIERLK